VLDAREIVQTGGQGCGVVDAIHVHTHWRRLGDYDIGLLLSPHSNETTERILGGLLDREARRIAGQLLDGIEPTILQILC
jgi:hypothetical protein